MPVDINQSVFWLKYSFILCLYHWLSKYQFQDSIPEPLVFSIYLFFFCFLLYNVQCYTYKSKFYSLYEDEEKIPNNIHKITFLQNKSQIKLKLICVSYSSVKMAGNGSTTSQMFHPTSCDFDKTWWLLTSHLWLSSEMKVMSRDLYDLCHNSVPWQKSHPWIRSESI